MALFRLQQLLRLLRKQHGQRRSGGAKWMCSSYQNLDRVAFAIGSEPIVAVVLPLASKLFTTTRAIIPHRGGISRG